MAAGSFRWPPYLGDTTPVLRENSCPQFRDVFCQSADGLKLHAKVIGPDDSKALPVLCLPA